MDSANETYIVAGCRPWNRRVFDRDLAGLPGRWVFVATPGELSPEAVDALAPRYVFFTHWSWRVPESIFGRYECVCFHMTDLPYGRGGSPLQNLIVRGHRTTVVTALRMVEELDAGPVYVKEGLSLEGNAEEIVLRATRLEAKLIRRIVEERIEPVPQEGEVVVFRRRTPGESAIGRPAGLGSPSVAIAPAEASNRACRRSLFVVRDMKAGECFSRENLRVIRPGQGLHPRHFEEILGRPAAGDIPRGTPLDRALIG